MGHNNSCFLYNIWQKIFSNYYHWLLDMPKLWNIFMCCRVKKIFLEKQIVLKYQIFSILMHNLKFRQVLISLRSTHSRTFCELWSKFWHMPQMFMGRSLFSNAIASLALGHECQSLDQVQNIIEYRQLKWKHLIVFH